MSKRYEFLDDAAELVTNPDYLEELSDTTDSDWDVPEMVKSGNVVLVIGNPWATAGALYGTREQIADTLRGWLAIVEAPVPVIVEAAKPYEGDYNPVTGEWQ